jgi:hypothetical protein
MKKIISLFFYLSFSSFMLFSCTDRNNDGDPDYQDYHDSGSVLNDEMNKSQGTENYPGNSENTSTEDKRYGKNTEIGDSTNAVDSVNHHNK